MKHKFYLLAFLICFCCKEENKNKGEAKNSASDLTKITDDIFKVTLDAKFLEDDKVELYFVGGSAEGSFNQKERVAKYIKGSAEFQVIEFSLPKGVIPYKFRVDIGDNINKHETQVNIKSVKLELNKNVIYIENKLLDSFFQPNLYLEKNDTGYLRKVIDNNYDPYILSKPVLNQKIAIEL